MIKESDILKELSKSEANFIRNTDIIINTDIADLINQLEVLKQENKKETESVQIIEIIIDKLSKTNMDNYNRIVFVEEDITDNILYSTSDIEDIKIGDEVFLEKNNYETEGFVKAIAYYKKDDDSYLLKDLYTITEVYYRSTDDEEVNNEGYFVPCKCCGSKEVPRGEIGIGYVCNNCGWEKDGVQEDNPDRKGGMNKMSLNEAKKAYKNGKKVF